MPLSTVIIPLLENFKCILNTYIINKKSLVTVLSYMWGSFTINQVIMKTSVGRLHIGPTMVVSVPFWGSQGLFR